MPDTTMKRSESGEPRLLLDAVAAGYGKVQILNSVSLSVHAHEIVAILGPNGSGKSTLIKTLMGLTSVYDGRIFWEGRDITRTRPHERAKQGLGYVPQTQNVFTDLKVSENLEMGAYFLRPEQLRQEMEHVYSLFPVLYDRRGVKAGNLSGGERRMLAIGSSLMMQPRFLLLDEPSSDLAPAMIDVVFDKIDQIHREYKIPMLMVEQNVVRAMDVASRLYVLVRGRIQLDAPVEEVTQEELGNLFLEVTSSSTTQ